MAVEEENKPLTTAAFSALATGTTSTTATATTVTPDGGSTQAATSAFNNNCNNNNPSTHMVVENDNNNSPAATNCNTTRKVEEVEHPLQHDIVSTRSPTRSSNLLLRRGDHPTICDNYGQLIDPNEGSINSPSNKKSTTKYSYQIAATSARSGSGLTDPLDRAEAGRVELSNYYNRDDDDEDDDETEMLLPRLVLRNRPFGQSSNRIHIQHNQGYKIYSLLAHNWFHVFLRFPTVKSITFLLAMWTGAIIWFALLYMWYDVSNPQLECGLGLPDPETGEEQVMTFAAAFAFSLETCTTVGYGLPHGGNNFFTKGCGGLQFLIYLQMVWSMLFNAFLLAFLYARLGRSETRSNQVINSRKALVSTVDGQVRFQTRLFDADARHPVVEAHVRMYCVMKHRPVPRPLRLLQPDDDLGGMLFLSFPTVVSHHIDLYSLLHPPAPPLETANGGIGILGMVPPSGLVLKQCDGATGNRDDVVCPVCGESYGTLERWKAHVRYCQMVEAMDDYPVEGSHLSIDLQQIEELEEEMYHNEPTKDLQLLKEYFRQNVSEVMVVVEGIDPMQSGTFQSLQSYRYEDIVWDEYSQWAPCLTILNNDNSNTTGERIFQVDLDRYHDIVIDETAVEEEQKRLQEEEEAAQAQAAAEAEATSRLSLEAESDHDQNSNANAIAIDNMPGLTALLAGAEGGADNNNNNNNNNGEELSSPLTVGGASSKPGHRRVRSSSRRPADGLFESEENTNNSNNNAEEEEDTVAGLTTIGSSDSTALHKKGNRYKRASRRPADGFIFDFNKQKPGATANRRATSEHPVAVPHPSLQKPSLKQTKSMPI